MIPGSPAFLEKQHQLKQQHQNLIKEKIDRILSQKMKQKEEDQYHIERMRSLDHHENMEEMKRRQECKNL